MRLSVESRSGKERQRETAARRFLDELPLVPEVLEGGIDEDMQLAAVLQDHARAHLLRRCGSVRSSGDAPRGHWRRAGGGFGL